MLIIWGFRGRLANVAMLTLACRNGHVAAHRLVKVTRWFTLFFIPVIPIRRSYYSVCAHCGLQVKWGKEEAEAAAAHATTSQPSTAEPVAPPLPSGQLFAGDGDAGVAEPVPATQSSPSSLPPAGWYPDPSGAGGHRYWDGRSWTGQVQPS